MVMENVPAWLQGPLGLQVPPMLKVPVRVVCCAVDRLNVAVTAWLEFIVTVQLPVPEQAPDHPANVEPVFGVAVSVTAVPAAKLRQPEPHEVPAGKALTVPLPVPDVDMVRAGVGFGVLDCTVIRSPAGVVAPL
jgi:hypothetical protein